MEWIYFNVAVQVSPVADYLALVPAKAEGRIKADMQMALDDALVDRESAGNAIGGISIKKVVIAPQVPQKAK